MKTLVIFNYAMDDQDPVFPHQISVVRDLSQYWSRIEVITYRSKRNLDLPSNVNVTDLMWGVRNTPLLLIRLFNSLMRIYFSDRKLVIFSFMTETISSIISPVTKMLGIKHYLWYAHTSKPFRLIWCHFFVNKIVTSTFQSCPIQSEKIVAIGQTVKNEDFECKNRPEPILRDHFNAIHVGRIDPSKNIDLIIEIFLKNFPEEKSVLHLVGSPTQKAFNYFNELLKLYEQQIRSKKIIFHGSLNQNEIKDLLCFSDVFLHAFQGSLDKSLLEAVFSKIFVISVNSGFRDEFSCLLPNENVISPVEYFESEIRLFKSIPWLEVQKLIDVRYEIAIEKHSRKKWITNLNQVLMESTQ